MADDTFSSSESVGKSGDGNMDSVSSLKSLLKLIEVECVIVNKECANKS